MRLLLDTNVILDALLERGDFATPAKELLAQGRQDHIEMISASAVTDIFYTIERAFRSSVNNKELSSKKAQEMLAFILDIVSVIAVDEDAIRTALSLAWRDYEDAVQFSVAIANGADYIVTRNIADYEKSSIPVVTPTEMLQILQPPPKSEEYLGEESSDKTDKLDQSE